jgi:hypothetical protein
MKNIKRKTSINLPIAPMILAVLMLLATSTASAQNTNFPTQSGGSGTEQDPFIISSIDDLDQLAADVNSKNSYKDKFFKLVSDLDYTGKTYNMIGQYSSYGGSGTSFDGNFDGGNHTISNVNFSLENTRYEVALFSACGGKIENLRLSSSTLRGQYSTAGIVVELKVGAVIQNCYVDSDVQIITNYNMAGIVSRCRGTMIGCVNAATVYVYNEYNDANFSGGIASYLADTGEAIDCYDISNSENSYFEFKEGYTQKSCKAYFIRADNGISMTIDRGTAQRQYNDDKLVIYPSGIEFDGKYYVFSKSTVNLTLSYTAPDNCEFIGYQLDNGTKITPNGSSYTFSMPEAHVKILPILKKYLTHSDIIVDIPAQPYTGSAIEPEITVTDGEKTLLLGTDYEVSYSDNTNVGTAKATITGKGNYTGTIEKTFINPAPITVTAENKSKTFGESDPEFTATVTGLVNNDSPDLIKYTLIRTEGENVGEYTITPKGDEKQGNYVVSFVDGKLTINAEPENIETATEDIVINSGIKIWSFEKTIFVENATKEIVVVDAVGRIVKTVKPVSDRTEIQFNKGGVYIVKSGIKTQKLIIQ